MRNAKYKNILMPKPQTGVLVVIVAVVIWFFSSFDESLFDFGVSTPLTNYMLLSLGNMAWVSRILGLVLVLIISFLLVRLNERYNIIRIQTFLPALFYVLMVGTVDNSSNVLNGGIIAAFFILLSISELLSDSKVSGRQSHKAFNVFLLLSLATLFYFELIVLVPFFWIGAVFFRMFDIRMFLASIVGFIFPYVFLVPIYIYWKGSSELLSILQNRFTFK